MTGSFGDMSESAWEAFAMDALRELAWLPEEGKKIAPGSGKRESWAELIIGRRLREAIARINPQLPDSAIDETVKIVLTPRSRDARTENHQVHEYLTRGIRGVVYIDVFGAEHNPTIRLIDRRDPLANEFLAVNQVLVADGDHRRRFDIVAYVNGMPLAIIELKKAGDQNADLEGAHAQLMTYVEELPMAFRCNVLCVVSDGVTARYGTAFTPFEHQLIKRIAKAQQYFAVSKAVDKTIEAVRSDGLAGVVWHTQGSGKSMEMEEMELYANQVLTSPALGNPTIVVLTDRTDLDDQLFDTFLASELLPEKPIQALTRDELRTELANRRTGGIIFSTLQKFGRTKAEREAGHKHPLLSDRRNIIVIVDEAHRSHYDSLDGYARHLRDALPHSTMIAFTGTPVSAAERNTRQVFGDYIDIYDHTRAVEDGATVPVYYEPRHIPVDLPADIDPELIDERADEATAGLDDSGRERIQRTVAVMNELYGAPDRLRVLADDLVRHWECRSSR